MSITETFPLAFWLLVGAALLVSSLGFYRFVYFISLGYGFSVAALGLVMMGLFWDRLTIFTTMLCVVLTVYGLRLGLFLLHRERKSASYRQAMAREGRDHTGVKLSLKLGTWVGCALLYTLQVSPLFFRLQNGAVPDVPACWGLTFMVGGLLLETVADYQKSAAKAVAPDRFCSTGVFRFVRCPNYLGELLFWTGVLISGLLALDGVWQWLAALAGWACLVCIMFQGARRLELRQNRLYGDDPYYRVYTRFTPILIPVLPLYSIENYTFRFRRERS